MRIVRPLELGEHASVWEAEDPDTGERVAIETLAGDAAGDEFVSEWFTEAWELAADIEDRGIVDVLRVGEQDGVPFAVRTPAGELNLAERLENAGPLAPGAALQVLTEVGGALGVAHDAGVVHGALEPVSVVLDEQGRAYLGGFGRREGDRREDVRALGELLVEMLGEPAGAPGPDDDEILSAHELAHAELLREVGRAGAEGGFSHPPELIAAARSARPGRTGGAQSGGGPSRLVVALCAVAAVVTIVFLLSLGGDDEQDDSSTSSQTTPAEATTSPDAAPATGPSRPVPVRGFPAGAAASDGVVYAVTRDGGSLDGFDEATGERVLGPVDIGPGGQDVTVVDGVAWVTQPDEGTLAGIDLSAEEPIATSIAAGTDPGPVVGAAGSIWVVDREGGQLLRFPQKLAEGTKPGVTELDARSPVDMAFGQGALWVSDADGKVLRVDPEDPSQQDLIEVGGKPASIFVTDDGGVWIADEADGAVNRLDPGSGKTIPFPVGGEPRDLAADPDHLYVANSDGYVTSILLGTGATEQVDLSGAGGSPQGIAVGQQVWVTTGSGNTLVAIGPASG